MSLDYPQRRQNLVYGGKSGFIGYLMIRPPGPWRMYWKTLEGLALWMDFNQCQAIDLSGNGNNGTIYGAQCVQGCSGRALNFDGVDDYVGISGSESLNPTEEITLCAWIFLKAKKTQGIIGKDGYWHLECYGDSAKFAFEGYFGDEWRLLLSNYYPELNKWYFVCSVFRANYVGLYVNGEEIKSDDWGEGIGTSVSRDVFVGKTVWAYFAGNEKYFNGIIDEVRIYNRALREEEIKWLYEHT